MNNLNKNHDSVLQNEKNVKKSQKHDANLQKNSTLYFQVGLILCLLGTYAALEMSFKTSKDFAYVIPEEDNTIYEVDPEIYKIVKKENLEKKKEVAKPKSKNPDFEIVDDKKEIEEAEDKIIDVVVPDDKKIILTPDDSSLNIEQPDEEPVNIMAVQKVPIFPGCEGETTNDGRRQCLSEKLSKLVQRKFDVDVASNLGITGKQRIYVSFKINKLGEVEIIKTKANHKDLEKEANRVVGKIPTMQPGKNNNKPVEVSYMLPIQFNIQ